MHMVIVSSFRKTCTWLLCLVFVHKPTLRLRRTYTTHETVEHADGECATGSIRHRAVERRVGSVVVIVLQEVNVRSHLCVGSTHVYD